MEFFDVIKKRRSIRKFLDINVKDEDMKKAFEAAILAPNSSNMQTWDFYWVKDEDKKKLAVSYCLNQSAARTANQLVFVTADPNKWKRSNPKMIEFIEKINAPSLVIKYYKFLIPISYRWGLFNFYGILKWASSNLIGLKRPITRGPNTKRDLQELCIKSAALACENFVLALTDMGYQTCMMEGIDEARVKKLLNISRSSRVVMGIAIGVEDPKRGTWGPQYRLPLEDVLHII